MLNFCGILHFNAHLLLTLDKETFTEEDKNKKVGLVAGVAARVFEWGGQKFDKILNLPHYAWMTDKIVRPKELLIPPKNSPLYLKL